MGSVQLPVWQGHPDCNAEQLVIVKAKMVRMAMLASLVMGSGGLADDFFAFRKKYALG
tara:strand:+ start:230 stop:403 length:174 start_codon:yes stop_codon:yes gene_type:complete